MAASSSRRRVRATSRVLRMAGSSSCASSPASRQEGRNRRVSTSARSGTFQPYRWIIIPTNSSKRNVTTFKNYLTDKRKQRNVFRSEGVSRFPITK